MKIFIGRHLTLWSLLIFCISAGAQVKHIEFDDGDKYNYEAFQAQYDSLHLFIMRFSPGATGLNFQFIKPAKYEVNAGISLLLAPGSALYGLGGSYLHALGHFKRGETSRLVLRKEKALGYKKFYMSEDVKFASIGMYGIHGVLQYYYPLQYNYSFLQAGLGGGYLKVQHMKYFVEDLWNGKMLHRSITKTVGFYMDALVYPVINYVPNKATDINKAGSVSRLGFQAYVEANSMKGKKHRRGFGYTWKAGAGYGLDKVFILLSVGFAF
jgi:hypothetical protein